MNATETIHDEIRTLSLTEVAVATNEGTYGAAECMRAIRTGDPAHGNYTIYESVGDGTKRVVGCDPERAPGYERKMGRDELADLRKRLVDLKKQARQAK